MPTGALDSRSSRNLMETFRRMNRSLGSTILMVTHDPVVGSYADRVLFLKDGRVWNEVYRGDRSRQALYREIMSASAALGGEGAFMGGEDPFTAEEGIPVASDGRMAERGVPAAGEDVFPMDKDVSVEEEVPEC